MLEGVLLAKGGAKGDTRGSACTSRGLICDTCCGSTPLGALSGKVITGPPKEHGILKTLASIDVFLLVPYEAEGADHGEDIVPVVSVYPGHE